MGVIQQEFSISYFREVKVDLCKMYVIFLTFLSLSQVSVTQSLSSIHFITIWIKIVFKNCDVLHVPHLSMTFKNAFYIKICFN